MRRVKQVLSVAITPLCLAVLLMEPSGLAQHEGGARDHETAAEPAERAEHHVANPIQNVTSFAYRGKNTEGGVWKEGEHKMPPPFSMQLLNFAVFAVLMYKAAWPSIARMTRDRHDAIAKALAEGTRLRDEAKARLDEYDRKLGALQGEIDELVRTIRAEAEGEKNRIIAEASARVERMKRDAEQQIQAEMQRVRDTLEREAVLAAVSIAERILTEKTTDADQRLLADRFVQGLTDATSRRRAGA
jgi:F-type H+-transporting ATPase subunit b